MPVVNLDGYYEVCKIYEKTHKFHWIRKNFKPSTRKHCSEDDQGVDVNRNYDIAFDLNNEGSNTDPCEEDYRGTHPFSTPAARQMRNFLESKDGKRVVVALNFHAYGNLLIHPFNYL